MNRKVLVLCSSDFFLLTCYVSGDGTHRAAYKVHLACIERNLNIAIVGVPKTIDNDIDYIDRSFGFVSAVEAAQASIRTALVEARCTAPNGIGVIKLMGREAGFLAAFAALGSGGDVDAVLVPEVPIVLEGPDGILPFIRQRVKEKKYAVVVVAEGAGVELSGRNSRKRSWQWQQEATSHCRIHSRPDPRILCQKR